MQHLDLSWPGWLEPWSTYHINYFEKTWFWLQKAFKQRLSTWVVMCFVVKLQKYFEDYETSLKLPISMRMSRTWLYFQFWVIFSFRRIVYSWCFHPLTLHSRLPQNENTTLCILNLIRYEWSCVLSTMEPKRVKWQSQMYADYSRKKRRPGLLCNKNNCFQVFVAPEDRRWDSFGFLHVVPAALLPPGESLRYWSRQRRCLLYSFTSCLNRLSETTAQFLKTLQTKLKKGNYFEKTEPIPHSRPRIKSDLW